MTYIVSGGALNSTHSLVSTVAQINKFSMNHNFGISCELYLLNSPWTDSFCNNIYTSINGIQLSC